MPKLLIVERDTDLQDVLNYNFAPPGFEVSMALCGQDALSHIEHEVPDLVITAERVEPVTGLELTRIIREKLGQAVKIIFYTTENIEEAALEAGADLFFIKPAPIKALLNGAKDTLGIEKSQAAHGFNPGV
ncbi:MAG: response regulator transcription factor [Alphaproteobacteria bacterium]